MTRQKRKKVDSSVEMSNNSLFGEDASANSTQNDKNPTSELIQKYKDMDNPTNNDLKELLIASLQAQTRTSDQISSIKHNLKATKGIVEENSSRIAVLEQNLVNQTELNKKLLLENQELRSEINIVRQKEVDNDVLITGFSDAPNINYVLDVLHQKIQFSNKDINKVNSWSIFQNGSRKGFMLISFVDKSAQISFMVKKIAGGPILLKEVLPAQNPDLAIAGNSQLYFNNRMSAANQDIQRKIRQLKKDKKIVASKFKNCQFLIKLKDGDEFLPVPTLKFLDEIFDANKTSY
jgi:hypothetical protein